MNLDDILDERLAIVGGTGSGKSYTARGLAERVLAKGGRLGVIDPTGVWYGLRTKADGKPGFPVVIFGGDRSDVPLLETAGRVIAQAVAATHQSWVIDTSALKSKAAERRFMLDFLDAIFMANRDDLTLVVDEADRFSPQRMNPESARLHERMEEIVRRGRVRGFTPWLITQRPASLNKDVLSQATAMISLRMTGSHDRKALADVIEGQAEKEDARRIIGAMPNHTVGHGLVWAPQQRILEAVHFPKILTADTMRAPKPGERISDKALPPIDLGKLKEQLAAVEVEAKANDPKALKAEVARLTRELAAKGSAPVDKAALLAEYERGYGIGHAAGLTIGARGMKAAKSALEHIARMATENAGGIALPDLAAAPSAPRPAPPRAAPVPRAPIAAQAADDGGLTRPQRHLLASLAWWSMMGHDSPRRPQVAAIAGWAPSGSNLRNRLTELSTKGLVVYPREGEVQLTPAGTAAAPEPDRNATMVDGIRKVLTNPQRILFDKLLELGGGPLDRTALAEQIGWEAAGSNLRNRLTELSTLEIVAYPSRGTVEISDWLKEHT